MFVWNWKETVELNHRNSS